MPSEVLATILALAGLLALALIARWALGRLPPAQISGRLIFDRDRIPGAHLTAGPFVVTWEPDEGGRVTIHHGAHPDKVVWSTQRGAGFVAAALGSEQVTGARGFFTIKDGQPVLLADQSIEAIAASSDGLSVTLSGALSRKGGQEAVRYTVTFSAVTVPGEPDALDFVLQVYDERLNRTFLTCAAEPDERIYGFGMQFTHFDLKGKRVPLFVTEQGVGRGAQPITLGANLTAGAGGAWHTTYAPVPHYVTSKLRSLFLHSYEYAIFDLRRDNCIQVQLWSPRMSGRILTGSSPADLIAGYTASTGRMRPLPDWMLEGAVVGMQGGTDKVRKVLAQLQELDTPVAAIWLEDWVGQRLTSFGKQLWWNWELDHGHYPGWETLRTELDAAGIRIMTYVNCHLADVANKPGHRRNLFREAAARGYLVRDREGEPYLVQNSDFSGGMIDLTNPAARTWLQDVIRANVIEAGATGWMADYGEALPYDAVLHSGEAASRFHNRYPEEWAKLHREVIEEQLDGDQFVFFSRSGYRESPRYSTLFWLGDQLVSWDRFDGIKTAVTGLLSSGLSGYSLNHSDIGGHTAVSSPLIRHQRSKELLLRWMELNAFTAIYRTHEGNRPDENHQFFSDAESLAHFSRFAKVYAAWAFYRKELVREASASGMPVVRHLFLHYPDDPNVYGITCKQFMVGSVFMVVPVLDPGVDTVPAYLPAGRWVHLWTGETYDAPDTGLTVTIAAPLGQPGVFYREGSPIAAQFVANLRKAGCLRPGSASHPEEAQPVTAAQFVANLQEAGFMTPGAKEPS